MANQNSIQEEIKFRLKAENSCYYSVETLLSSRLLSKNLKLKFLKQYCQLCYVVVEMVSYIKGGMRAKGISKQDPEANIWAQEG